MGTNYYAHINACYACGHAEEVFHLGKSSVGWRFCAHAIDALYHSWDAFCDFIQRDDVKLVDEYGEVINANDLMNKIIAKCDGRAHGDCVTSGPIDLVEGEFC